MKNHDLDRLELCELDLHCSFHTWSCFIGTISVENLIHDTKDAKYQRAKSSCDAMSLIDVMVMNSFVINQ